MTKLSLKINVAATKQHLWEIITHPEQYPAYISGVREVTVLQRNQSVALIRWKVLIDGVGVEWTEQCQYDKDNCKVWFHATRGDFSAYDGTLAIERAPKGVNLVLDATFDWGLPSFEKVIASVVENKVRRAFMGMLINIRRHAEANRLEQNYAFVIHPLDLGLISVAFQEPNIVSKRKELVSKAFEWLPPFKCSDIVGLKALNGLEVNGALIYCPLLPEQMVANDGELALKRTIEAVQVAESQGAKVVGLGAYAAQIGHKGVLVAEAVRVPVTTGTSYTIATAIHSIESACMAVGVDLQSVSVGIVGATGGIGSACAELLAGKVRALVLNARNQTRLDDLAGRLKDRIPDLHITQTSEIDWLIANSDIIITATNTPTALIDAKRLRPGTIVCDVSRPRNVSPESDGETNGSVLVFDGGIVKPPGEVDFDFYFGLPPG
jgi:predicted amino acid dehydrogenase/ribosome-associated toxin RatA of RatAB toxin-antitoxin module